MFDCTACVVCVMRYTLWNYYYHCDTEEAGTNHILIGYLIHFMLAKIIHSNRNALTESFYQIVVDVLTCNNNNLIKHLNLNTQMSVH